MRSFERLRFERRRIAPKVSATFPDYMAPFQAKVRETWP